MKHTFVNKETARLLRKHWFNESVEAHYDSAGELQEKSEQGIDNWNRPAHDKNVRHQAYSAPELSLAQQWLREKKRFDVLVYRDYFCGKVGKYYATIIRLRDGALSETRRFRSYEKALEAGIVKALKTL